MSPLSWNAGERVGPLLVIILLATSWFSAGLSLMTHMHHRGLAFISSESIRVYDAGYETISDWTVIPSGVIGLICITVLLLLARPRAVPRSLIFGGFLLQASVFVMRIFMWGVWAEEVREAGNVRLPGGEFHPLYELYMEWSWLRILIIFSYALLALAMAVLVGNRAPQS